MRLMSSSKARSSDGKFEFLSGIHQVSHRKPVYYAAFNHVDPGLSNVFATVGGNEVHVYALQAAADGPETPEPLQCFVDENAEECFYSVEWTFKQPGGDPVILCAGTSGIIKAIQCSSGKVDSFVGHGGDVYEVKTNPLNPDIFLSVSKDKSCRIWSLALGCCLAILAGEDGHGEEVLSADFDDEGRVLTSGMDHTVKIWDLTPEIQKFVETSDPSFLGVSATNVEKHKIVKYLQFPRFTGNIHSNYVDCVRAYGHFVLSKSVEEKISLWRPEQKKNRHLHVHDFDFNNCDIWFVKFGMDLYQKFMAVGNLHGEVFVWNLGEFSKDFQSGCEYSILKHPHCNSIIRLVSFSHDARWLVAVSDDAMVWIWKRNSLSTDQ